jgi:hypothetical protein
MLRFGNIAIGIDQIRSIDFNLPSNRDLGIVSPGLFPPIAIFSKPLSSADDAKKLMAIYGRVDYTDMFPIPKPRYSLFFCQRANTEVTVAIDAAERACEKHNYIK